MIEIKAKHVRELRNISGAPMMDCKQALLETKGNMDDAVDWLRKKGAQMADKKSGRDANQGLVGVHINQDDVGAITASIVEVNCETDFVAKNEVFQDFVADVAKRSAVGSDVADTEVTDLVAKIGENIKLGEKAVLHGGKVIASYVHNKVADDLGTIGVLVVLDGEPSDELAALGNDIAMHIAASNPKAVDESSLDQDWLAHERKIFVEQAQESGKPEAIIEKMVDGRIKKVVRENTLIHQPFVKNPDRTVADILSESNATVVEFIRIAVGE